MSDKCDIVKDLLPLYMEDICSSSSKDLIEDHLTKCNACNQIYQHMKQEISLPDEEIKLDQLTVKKPFKKIKKYFLLSIATVFSLLVIIFSVIIYEVVFRPDIVNTDAVIIYEVLLEDQYLQISGDAAYSAMFFTGDYEVMYDGAETLYVQLKSQLTNRNNASGRFHLHFYFDGEFSNVDSNEIKYVYLQGKSPDDVKLIWNRK